MRISYGITAYNENRELDRLLSILSEYVRTKDEVIVLLDSGYTEEVRSVLEKFEGLLDCHYDWENVHDLNRDFANHKNYLNSLCKGDYIFQLDADEYPHENLLEFLPSLIEINEVDLIWVPRVNTVEGLTQQHIDKWGWDVNESGWINFPDLQNRIYKNSDEIYWVNKVHEKLVGFNNKTKLPYEERWSIYHPKEINRQEKQNSFYQEILREIY